jgi:hypothetical protein
VSIHNPNVFHLSEDDILQAVIDEADLSVLQRQHLVECSRCRSSKERTENELMHLGQLAERFTPEPLRRVTLAKDKIRAPFLIRGFVLGAAAAALIIIVVWAAFLTQSPPPGNVGNLAQNMVEAERLMTEIDGLVENALPPGYLDIVGETRSSQDQDFMDFLIPDNGSTPRISAVGKKGSILC